MRRIWLPLVFPLLACGPETLELFGPEPTECPATQGLIQAGLRHAVNNSYLRCRSLRVGGGCEPVEFDVSFAVDRPLVTRVDRLTIVKSVPGELIWARLTPAAADHYDLLLLIRVNEEYGERLWTQRARFPARFIEREIAETTTLLDAHITGKNPEPYPTITGYSEDGFFSKVTVETGVGTWTFRSPLRGLSLAEDTRNNLLNVILYRTLTWPDASPRWFREIEPNNDPAFREAFVEWFIPERAEIERSPRLTAQVSDVSRRLGLALGLHGTDGATAVAYGSWVPGVWLTGTPSPLCSAVMSWEVR